MSLDFSFSANEKDIALKKAKEFFYEKALPQLNSQFDSVIPYVYIDKLEIDVGKVNTENFASQFRRSAAQALQEYFYKKGNGISQPANETPVFSADTIIYFLQKGYWQWNFQMRTDTEMTSLIKRLMKNEKDAFRLFALLKEQNVYARERFAAMMLIRPSLADIFLQQLKKHHPALEGCFPLDAVANLTQSEKDFYSTLIREIIASASLQNPEEVKRVLEKFMRLYPPVEKKEIISLKKILETLSDRSNASEWGRFYKMLYQSFYRHSIIAQQNTHDGMTISESYKEKEISDTPKYFEEGERVHISNAGLILFHPYLPYVFKELKWINDEKKFADENSQQKAILFLQYLINQKSRQAEHELLLNKILCNWPINKPVKAKIIFLKKEKKAAVELIESLKEHWKILKNTSRQGLIKSFVERKGTIQQRGEGFLLQVEKNTIDILMESLPFGIQTIKLPWNEYLIHTEWVY